jgi:hypothetical protein
VPASDTEADVLLRDNGAAAARLASELVVPLNNNFVERPWGGFRLPELKRAPADGTDSRRRIGECFEIAADDRDAEARRYPSRIRFVTAPSRRCPRCSTRTRRHCSGRVSSPGMGGIGRCYRRTLDVVELLSVQAHPPGNTEVYMILAAEPGARRCGSASKPMSTRNRSGRVSRRVAATQQRLKQLCGSAFGDEALQSELKPGSPIRAATPAALEPGWRPLLDKRWPEVASVLRALHAAYWDVLDLMNEIPVAAGQVLYNATPERIAAARGIPRSAEIHALGNTQALENRGARDSQARHDLPRVGQRALFRFATSTPTPQSRR